MKLINPLKVPFGTAKFSPITRVNFHQWEDGFVVDFEDGLSFFEPHTTIRKANKIATKAMPTSVELDEELRSGFDVHYDNGQIAEVSWAFIRESAPAPKIVTRKKPAHRSASRIKG